MNKQNFPLFTVIIPLKDREEYIGHTLKTCMIQDYPNFEIIVSDDCSSDNTVKVAIELAEKDKRIQVYSHKKHLGMHDNFEFALNKVKPGYVIALGGDDGLVQGCIWRMYEILKTTGKELLTWTPATFAYPSNGETRNMFYLKRKKYDGIKILKSKDYLNKISKTFFYMTDDCPMFYMKGVASTNLVDRVKSRTNDNSFYYCPTPDGYSGVVLAGEVEDYAFTYEPLTIVGASPKSQGNYYISTDKKSREESELFFNDNVRRTMHKQLASQPYSPLITLMTADYLLTANDLPGWPGKGPGLNYEDLLNKTFTYLHSSNFPPAVLSRELKIIREIAVQHNLLEQFDILYNTTKKRVRTSKDVYGFLITNSIRFNGADVGINNIYDAAKVTDFIYKFYNRMTFSNFISFVKNQFRVVINQRKYKLVKLPSIE